MGGEVVRKMEPRTSRGVSFGGGLGARVSALEHRMLAVESGLEAAVANSAEAVANTAELLAIASAAKGTYGFLKKHGPRMIAFGTGIATAAGVDNPKVLHFISAFFGG